MGESFQPAPNNAPSSPVAGTPKSADFRPQVGNSLSRNLSRALDAQTQSQTWLALAKIGEGLLQLANAQLGKLPVQGASLPLLHQPAPADLTLTELINEFLRAKARAGRSDRYLRALRNSLSKFQHGRASVPLSAIDLGLIEAWISKNHWAPRTVQGYVSDLKTLFNWAVRRGYLGANPAAGFDFPAPASAPPAIHTPEQVAIVLQKARETDGVLCRALALRYFAGVRSAEVQRLTEANITPGDYLEVPAACAKTRARRLVPIAANLGAWLAVTPPLPITNQSDRQRRLVHLLAPLGITWPQNVARHSFISYRLAAVESAGKVAMEAGNSEAMIFRHYRELVTPAAAAAYWAIVP